MVFFFGSVNFRCVMLEKLDVLWVFFGGKSWKACRVIILVRGFWTVEGMFIIEVKNERM